MDTNLLQQAYREQLILSGVSQALATEVAENLTPCELQLISEIWSTWAIAFAQHQLEDL